MYKHSSLLLAAAAILHHTNAGLVWNVPNGITMPIAKRYSTQDLIFDLKKGRSPQYIDTIGCKDFLVNPTLYNRGISGWDETDLSQFDGVAQLPAGSNLKQYDPNCYTASYSSDNPLVGRDNQPPDYNNFDVPINANPSPVGETRTDPWTELKVPNYGTSFEADNSDTGNSGAHDTPVLGKDPIASAQTGAYDVPAPLQPTLVVTGGQDIKLPSPGTDPTNTPYNTAFDTTVPYQGTDIRNPTPNIPSFEYQLDNAQYVPSPFPPLSSVLHSQKPGVKLTLTFM